MKQFHLLLAFFFTAATCKAQLVINELSQGPSGTKEYVEFLVTGTPVCGGPNTVDLRGWIIDDNNSWHGTGSGTGIAGGHVRFDSITQWANVKIGSIILVFNDADVNTNVAALAIDSDDANHDCVYIIPISSSVLQKNITLPVSNGSMTTYAVPGTIYTGNGTWICLGMANSDDAFHTVSPSNYSAAYHAIGWGGDNTLVNIYYGASQGGKTICMVNRVDNNPFNPTNFIDTATVFESPGAPNNAANAAWISGMNNNCQPFVSPQLSFNNPVPLSCNNSSTVLIASSTSVGASFNWSNSITGPNDTVSAAGTYYVTVTDAAQICTATDSITVAPATGLSVSTSSTNTTCGNSNGSALVTITLGAASSFHWSNGDSTASVTNLGAGNYTVTVNGGIGCSATASVTINTSSITPVIVSVVDSIFCSGDSTQVCAPSGFTSYLWNNGTTSTCFFAKQAGNYYVTVTDNASCTATSNHLTVSVYPLPPVSISVNGDTLSAYNAVAYQWYLNNTIIGGATNNIYIAHQSGSYTVAISDTNGCVVFSNPVNVTVSGMREIGYDDQLDVYPNPISTSGWNVITSTEFIGASLKVFDNTARLVYQSTTKSETTEIDFYLPKGIYWLQLTVDKKVLKKKLIRL